MDRQNPSRVPFESHPGFVEMLARQVTAELRAERYATPPGSSTPLIPEHSVMNRRVGPSPERFDSQNHKSLLSRRLGLSGSQSSLKGTVVVSHSREALHNMRSYRILCACGYHGTLNLGCNDLSALVRSWFSRERARPARLPPFYGYFRSMGLSPWTCRPKQNKRKRNHKTSLVATRRQ